MLENNWTCLFSPPRFFCLRVFCLGLIQKIQMPPFVTIVPLSRHPQRSEIYIHHCVRHWSQSWEEVTGSFDILFTLKMSPVVTLFLPLPSLPSFLNLVRLSSWWLHSILIRLSLNYPCAAAAAFAVLIPALDQHETNPAAMGHDRVPSGAGIAEIRRVTNRNISKST